MVPPLSQVVVCAGVNFPEGRKLRVAVVGGGPAGASAADQLAKDGVETFLIERKMDNCKPCGGAIPLCHWENELLTVQYVFYDLFGVWRHLRSGKSPCASAKA